MFFLFFFFLFFFFFGGALNFWRMIFGGEQFLVMWVLWEFFDMGFLLAGEIFGHVDYDLGIFFPCDLSWNDELNYCVAKP